MNADRGRMRHRERIRVLVGDGYPVYREGLVRSVAVRPELELVGEASDGRHALECIAELRPDLALLDLRLPGLAAPAVLAALARDRVPTRVVFLSDLQDGEAVYQALAGGAFGCLAKDAEREEICEALLAAARGKTVISPELQTAFIAEVRLRERTDRPVLTVREREILVLTADGLSGPQIAERLFVSPNTVKTHLHHLYEKLGVSDRAAAVAEGMRQGVLE